MWPPGAGFGVGIFMGLQKHYATADADRLSLRRIAAYGLGGLIPIALFNIAGQLMGLIGNIGLGLSAFWLGVIMIIPRLWDAVSDPVMGHISDNARTPWGRRRPFILLGGIAVAVSFVLMWWIPSGEGVRGFFGTEASYNWFRLGYILLWLLIFFTACTIFEIPHGALGMEMAGDTHERTRLFSAKSFLGNLFAMGTPWLFFLANLEVFKGPGGNEADGMRWVSMLIAVVLIPLAVWWFATLKEPVSSSKTERIGFLENLKTTFENRRFLLLVSIFFILAMGFNFVGLLNYYISIFYIYGGDKVAAGPLLGVNGTVWGLTGLVAVFPLVWLDKRLGKRNALVSAILLMCGAQLSKIVCYNPSHPYLVLIPTVMLSAGMLMFFTLGPSMLGDICDENELKTGRRTDGSYYAVFWWFIKMGTAFASLVTGILIVVSQFDEAQSVGVDKLKGSIEVMQATGATPANFDKTHAAIDGLRAHFSEKKTDGHTAPLLEKHELLEDEIQSLENGKNVEFKHLLSSSVALAQQAPKTLLRLRVIEITLPLILSALSLFLTFRYSLTEERVYEIKAELEHRKARASNG